MSQFSVRNLQQSEIFFVLFLFLLLALIVLNADTGETNKQGILEPSATRTPPPDEKPPIITLPEASGYKFVSGSAKLSDDFQTLLSTKIIPQLENHIKVYNVNVIEIIGHTDGQILKSGGGNLDNELENAAYSGSLEAIDALTPASNADLGLMRALSVIKFFQFEQTKGHLIGIHFRPYSAGQILLPDGQLAHVDRNPDGTRRRIELRLIREE
jgi:hypothetical protein